MSVSYALIKWIDKSNNKNKYTPDIPVDWILDFDEQRYRKGKVDRDKAYVIQWCNGKKPPKAGWKCYDGIVIDVSSKIKINLLYTLK